MIGGPIRHDKTFFFADYQGTRIIQPSTTTQTLETVAQRSAITTGNFSAYPTIYNPFTSSPTRVPFAGNLIPAQLLDPVAVKLVGLLPGPSRQPPPKTLPTIPRALRMTTNSTFA